MSQLNNASLSELRAVAHALCEDAKYRRSFVFHLGNLDEINSDDLHTTDHIDLIEQATAQELLDFQTSLCTHDLTKQTQQRVDNYLQVLRYAKPAGPATEAAEPLDPIKNATAKEFHRVMISLCSADGIMNRVATHLRMLRPPAATAEASPRGHFKPPPTPYMLVNAATETELHAIGLGMCEVDEDMKRRVLECLRIISIFGQLQGTNRKHATN